MAQIPEIYPAHASRPFVRPHGSGIVFSAVFPRGMECGLQLIHTPDGETLYIPFTDEFRVGRVCSAMITPLDSKEWMYRYKSGEHWIPDPHAFAAVVAASKKLIKIILICGKYHRRLRKFAV